MKNKLLMASVFCGMGFANLNIMASDLRQNIVSDAADEVRSIFAEVKHSEVAGNTTYSNWMLKNKFTAEVVTILYGKNEISSEDRKSLVKRVAGVVDTNGYCPLNLDMIVRNTIWEEDYLELYQIAKRQAELKLKGFDEAFIRGTFFNYLGTLCQEQTKENKDSRDKVSKKEKELQELSTQIESLSSKKEKIDEQLKTAESAREKVSSELTEKEDFVRKLETQKKDLIQDWQKAFKNTVGEEIARKVEPKQQDIFDDSYRNVGAWHETKTAFIRRIISYRINKRIENVKTINLESAKNFLLSLYPEFEELYNKAEATPQLQQSAKQDAKNGIMESISDVGEFFGLEKPEIMTLINEVGTSLEFEPAETIALIDKVGISLEIGRHAMRDFIISAFDDLTQGAIQYVQTLSGINAFIWEINNVSGKDIEVEPTDVLEYLKNSFENNQPKRRKKVAQILIDSIREWSVTNNKKMQRAIDKNYDQINEDMTNWLRQKD